MNDKTNGFDLAAFDTVSEANNGALMEVLDPRTGEIMRFDDGRPFTIKVLGQDSDAYVLAWRKQQDRKLREAARSRSRMLDMTSEELDRNLIDLLVAVTVDWDLVLDGKKAEATPEAFRAAYTKYPRLRSQVETFISAPINFSKG